MTPHERKIAAIVSRLLEWYPKHARDLPWRRTKDPYPVFVSEIMLQQTQVKTVVPYWERWMRELPTIEAAAKASPDQIHKLWEGLGYYSRARNLQQAARQIMAQHHGQFPRRFEDVLALPGIGRYTAGAICSIAFNQPTAVLDGNVIRVLARVFGIAENPKEQETKARLWELAGQLVCCAKEKRWGETTGEPARKDARPTENKNCSHFNQSLMELGALVCLPRNPQCTICPVKKHCAAFRDGRAEELPNLGKRVAATPRYFVAFVVERKERFLVRQRPAGVVNGHLWEFPNAETEGLLGDDSTAAVRVAAELFGSAPMSIFPFCTIKHSITRYRITLDVFVAGFKNPPRKKTTDRWRTLAELEALAFSSAHKRVLKELKTNRQFRGIEECGFLPKSATRAWRTALKASGST